MNLDNPERSVQDVEAELAALQAELARLRQHNVQIRTSFDLSPLATAVIAPTTGWIEVNAALCDLLTYTREELVQTAWSQLTHPDDLETDRLYFDCLLNGDIDFYSWDKRLLRKDGSVVTVNLSVTGVFHPSGTLNYAIAYAQDITERLRSQQQIRRLKEQLTAAQQVALQDRTAPLMPLADGVVTLTLVGAMDRLRVQQVMDTLLEGVARQHIRTTIIDITGMRVIDMQVARVLAQIARAVHLLGAEVVISGIHPELAQALAWIGVDFSGIVTRATLQESIAYALRGRSAPTVIERMVCGRECRC